jgi:hypothetical protein
MFGQILSYGVILQALALIHFLRRQPSQHWLWVIIFFGPIGAGIYIVLEVLPDLGLLRNAFDAVGRRKRIAGLEALVVQNPSAGNYEELGDLLLEEKKWAQARECYDKAISPRTADPDAFYRRGIAEIQLGDFAAAVKDLDEVMSRDAKYDSHRAMALLAHACANAGEPARADELFQRATEKSTLCETYYNYAEFLAAQQRPAEAREWAERLLANKAAMPRFLQRRERPWFRKAGGLLKKLPK